MSMWWSLHLRREAASVPLARRFLLGSMETAGVDPDVSFELSVALSEACANAVEHGGEADGPDGARPAGQYRVTVHLDGATCRIEVADSGPGFPLRHTLHTDVPPTAPQYPGGADVRDLAESGRGLGLIEQLADHVHIGNRPGHGAVVSFDKALKWREDALLTRV
ncbi:ATP-binding protein [uncultured Streptomyces sp.]|uniref:ATP-binding protein n=1 Tax=uncultured Streptomyces sp. TaxID=174707 RepID=UPI002609AD6A|nr:ATP-binding protein [uncultured Streptomyces sp.]